MRIGLCVVILAALLGCSTTPDLPAEQQPAHAEYVLSPQMAWRPEMAGTHGRVRLARDSGLVSGACPFTVFVNNEPVVRLFAGQYFEAALPAGRHEIYVTFAGFFICPGDISGPTARGSPLPELWRALFFSWLTWLCDRSMASAKAWMLGNRPISSRRFACRMSSIVLTARIGEPAATS